MGGGILLRNASVFGTLNLTLYTTIALPKNCLIVLEVFINWGVGHKKSRLWVCSCSLCS